MPWEMIAFHIAALAVAAFLLIAAAFTDAQSYRIPNAICASLLAIFPIFVLTAPRPIEWDQNLMVFGLLLLSGMAMFFGNLAGAGDVKLLATTGLWAGPHFVALFIIATAIAGGVLALVMAGLTTWRNRKRVPTLPVARTPIPYGIAIALGGLITMYRLSEPILFPS